MDKETEKCDCEPHVNNEMSAGTSEKSQNTSGKYLEQKAQQETSRDKDGLHQEPIKFEQEVLKVPDGGWGWFIVLGACLVHVITGGFERSNGVIYLQLLSRYGMSATATSWVLSLFTTLRLIMGPLASALCNKYSCRAVVMLGAIISSVGVLISAYVPSLPYLYLTYGVLGGVGRAFTYIPCLIIVGYYFNKRRGIAVGVSTSGVGFGGFVFAPVIEILFNYYGFEGTFLILSAVMSNFFICGALFRPLELQQKLIAYDRRKHTRQTAMSSGNTEEKSSPHVIMSARAVDIPPSQLATKVPSSVEISSDAESESAKPQLEQTKWSPEKCASNKTKEPKTNKKKLLDLTLFRNFAFCTLCIQLFLFTLSFNSTFVFLPALSKERNIPQIEGAYLISILGIFDAISRIVLSVVLDLKRVKRYRLVIYNVVMFVNGIVSILMPLMRTFWQLAIMSALYGVLSGIYISQKSVILVDILGVEKLSSSFGLLVLFQGVGGLVGPTVGGLFKDFLGNYDMAFYFGSIGIIAGGVIMAIGNIWLHRQKKTETQQKLDN